MEKKSYSKVYTQFETQAMAYGRVKVGLKNTPLFVRGNNDYLMVFQTTSDSYNPTPILKINVKASQTAAEVGFKKLSPTEVEVVGMDIAWQIMDFVAPMLRSARAEGGNAVPSHG